jgi:glycine/D-amino acid oxidase-like deaminating enzyme
MSHCQHVLVVGGGIVGASIALHLLRGGARVTLIEGGNSGGVATRNSFAWINANRGNPLDYFRLRVRAIEEWHELERSLPHFLTLTRKSKKPMLGGKSFEPS